MITASKAFESMQSFMAAKTSEAAFRGRTSNKSSSPDIPDHG